jgi:hypothetical protein
VTRVALFASIVLGIGSLALGYARAGWITICLLLLAFGAIWFFSQWRGWGWFSMTGLALAVFTAAAGLLLGINSGWMFAGVLSSLLAWDLIEFRHRLRFATVDSNVPSMEKRHFLHLSILAIVGIILELLITFVHLQFSFGWLVFLALVAAIGLTQLNSQSYPRKW